MQSTQGSKILIFPKSKKRRSKARTGLSALVIALPSRCRAVNVIKEATSTVDRLVAIMSWAEREYRADRPSASAVVNDLRALGVLQKA